MFEGAGVESGAGDITGDEVAASAAAGFKAKNYPAAAFKARWNRRDETSTRQPFAIVRYSSAEPNHTTFQLPHKCKSSKAIFPPRSPYALAPSAPDTFVLQRHPV
jgi:hypothetical protein